MEPVCAFVFRLFEHNGPPNGREDPIVGCMPQINNIVLNKAVVLDFLEVELKLPGHRCRRFGLNGKINKVSDDFVDLRVFGGCFHRYPVRLI